LPRLFDEHVVEPRQNVSPMNAEQILSLADRLRSHALENGEDLNASNLFVHRMLVHALSANGSNDDVDAELEEFDF
jgi:hypothetical protein